jgi:hypothetical protein
MSDGDDEVTPALLANLRKALSHSDDSVAAAALAYFELVAPSAYFKLVARSVDEQATRILAEVEQATPALERIVSTAAMPARLRAARALGHLHRGAGVAVPALREILARGTSDYRRDILIALELMSPQAETSDAHLRREFAEIVPLLVQAAHISDNQSGIWAVQVLLSLSPHIEAAAEALAKLRAEPDFEYRALLELPRDRDSHPAMGGGGRP